MTIWQGYDGRMKIMKKPNKEIVVYKTAAGEELPVATDGETVWMTICEQCDKGRGA